MGVACSHTTQLWQSAPLKWALYLICAFMLRPDQFHCLSIVLASNISCFACEILLSFLNLNYSSYLWSPSWSNKQHHKRTQSDRALDWKAHSQRLRFVHRWSTLCIFTWTALVCIYSSFLTLWISTFNISTKVEAKAGVRTLLWIRNFLGIVPGETAAHNCGYFSRSRNWVALSLQEWTLSGEDLCVTVRATVMQPAAWTRATQ